MTNSSCSHRQLAPDHCCYNSVVREARNSVYHGACDKLHLGTPQHPLVQQCCFQRGLGLDELQGPSQPKAFPDCTVTSHRPLQGIQDAETAKSGGGSCPARPPGSPGASSPRAGTGGATPVLRRFPWDALPIPKVLPVANRCHQRSLFPCSFPLGCI